ncbi:hypothetical protein AYO39_01395 [Actinobacteria bacterium SCGC AG-212-D09]|nr:hypothetical protein AYO39_01395 [Actinobacteria bacterium SCGC AG-212-D09]
MDGISVQSPRKAAEAKPSSVAKTNHEASGAEGRRASPTSYSDDCLVMRAQRGDKVAFELLYNRHHRAIVAYCTQLMGSAADGEDAAQHTFLSAHKELGRRSGGLAIRPWLFRVAHNRCMSMLRVRKTHVDLDDVKEQSVSPEMTATIAIRESLRELVSDLERLPAGQRSALVMAQMGDMSGKEISTVLECTPAKVRALIFQARDSLVATREGREARCEDVREIMRNHRGRPPRLVARHLDVCEACRHGGNQAARPQRAPVADWELAGRSGSRTPSSSTLPAAA